MILVTSNDGTLSCSPSLVNMSMKFCGVSAMRTSCRLQRELQPLLQRMQGQSGQPADQGTVEADVLQVAADGELDAADQHVDVPTLHLVSNEAADAALLAVHEIGQNPHHAAVDLGADRGIPRQLPANIDQHGFELASDL